VVMEKKVGGFFIKVPCIDDVGSCNYSNLCASWADICPTTFAKYGIPCQCPIAPNIYSVPDVEIDIASKLPFIADGDLRVTADLSSDSGHFGCLRIQVTIKT
jgi:ganglioside GM2 activator